MEKKKAKRWLSVARFECREFTKYFFRSSHGWQAFAAEAFSFFQGLLMFLMVFKIAAQFSLMKKKATLSLRKHECQNQETVMNNIKKERCGNSRPLFAAGARYFCLDTKVPKRSRKNDASPLEANAWPAVLSGLRSWGSGKWVGVVAW